jgi:hypothetical protein
MKWIFGALLLGSIVYPVYAFFELLSVSTHNHWAEREQLMAVMDTSLDSANLGLTGAELAELDQRDQLASTAYTRAVVEAARLGRGYTQVWNLSLGLSALLCTASLCGLWLCRQSRRLKITRTEDPTSADPH